MRRSPCATAQAGGLVQPVDLLRGQREPSPVAKLAAAVLRAAVDDGDAGFFTVNPDLAFWCAVAGLEPRRVRWCYRSLRPRRRPVEPPEPEAPAPADLGAP